MRAAPNLSLSRQPPIFLFVVVMRDLLLLGFVGVQCVVAAARLFIGRFEKMPYALSDLVQLVVTERGEAIHLHDREAPVLEFHGILHRVEGPALEAGDTQTMFRSFAPKAEFQAVAREGLAVFEHTFGHPNFFRLMAFREDDSFRLELRRVL
jgi:hypothetical protein